MFNFHKNKIFSKNFTFYFILFFVITIQNSFALLEFPTYINQNIGQNKVQNQTNFFQSMLQKINFGGNYFTNTNSVNTFQENSSKNINNYDYDLEYQNILKQNNINIDNYNNDYTSQIKSINFKQEIVPGDKITNLSQIVNTTESRKFLTKEELDLKLQEFILQLNNKLAPIATTSTKKISEKDIDQSTKDNYYKKTGKVYNQQNLEEQGQNYFSDGEANYYNQLRDVRNIYNPATAYNPELENLPESSIKVTMNQSNFTQILGNRSDLDSRLFKILDFGWLETKASNFGLNTNGAADKTILPKYGCETAMSSLSASGPIRVCNTSTCVVSMPREVINYYYGKVDWKDRKSIYKKYKQIAGNRIEIYNYKNGRCAIAPLWEIGPGREESLRNGFGIDLTYCVKVNMLQTTSGAPTVKYRPVPEGKVGCEDYIENRILAPVIFNKK